MIPGRLEPLLRAEGLPARLARRFADAGHDLFLVGGSVRDALLDRDVELDFDFATDAHPEAILHTIKGMADDVYTMGQEFGTIGVILDGDIAEITTYRSEIYRDDSRKPVVTFGDDLETDLSRRDFTVNAMALRIVPEPEVVDPFGGLADLAAGRLRTPLDPAVAFSDDPLRMLRLFRFVSALGFEPDPAAVAAVGEMSDRLEIVSPERVREELDKLIVGEFVEAGLWGLVDSGLADRFVPELAGLALEQDPVHHHKDVLAHTIAVVAKCPPDRVVRLAALFHDIGKPDTREFGLAGVTFHHHEVVGARMTRHRMRELRYSRDDVANVSDLVYLHMRPHTFKQGWTDRAVRRYVRDAGPLLHQLNTLVRCDVTTRNPRREREIMNRIDELEDRIADLAEREELEAIRPPIDGHAVMSFLGVKPGPIVGEALDLLLEHRLDEGPYSEDEAYEMLRSWAAERGIEIP
ncbi:MAG TPA: CCA tRNA nucleotidyltransferase [Acidimicrobiia bacterium]|nr:CCA tRNA nucleotidyltransferase [Acidimicrobiia bacterium]